MRGTLRRQLFAEMVDGIIPALAGNTFRNARVIHAHWDHPRACGEHRDQGHAQPIQQGSSPRLRGTPDRDRPATMGLGIIPALAGNTAWLKLEWFSKWDHPRACGEHPIASISRAGTGGSSPRLRGTPNRQHQPCRYWGIIPALAGNTYICMTAARPQWDHPRACGEHLYINNAEVVNTGSSPRLRGTQAGQPAGSADRGIIPALAGNT